MRRIGLTLMIIGLVAISCGHAVEIESLAGEYNQGDIIEISGTTNLAAGNELIITVISLSFSPTAKDTPAAFSGTTARAMVLEGEERNTESSAIDTTGFIADEYIVMVESVETAVSADTTFTLREAVLPTLEERPEATPDLAITPQAEAEPAAAPGFPIAAAITAVAIMLAFRRR